MTTRRRRQGEPSSRAAAPSPDCSTLVRHLVHTREVPNGRDFLFSGPTEEVHQELKHLVDLEHRREGSLQMDYVRVEDYFLLRIVGPRDHREKIEKYFLPGDPG